MQGGIKNACNVLTCMDTAGAYFAAVKCKKSRNETGISGDFRLMQPPVDKFYSLLSCVQLPEMV